jgi:hypothetical protein
VPKLEAGQFPIWEVDVATAPVRGIGYERTEVEKIPGEPKKERLLISGLSPDRLAAIRSPAG